MAYTTIDKPTDYVQCIGWTTAGTNSSGHLDTYTFCLLYTSPSPRDRG